MKQIALCLVLLLAASLAFAMQPPQASAQDQAKGDSNNKIQDSIENVLQADPMLSGAQVESHVDDQSITLTGTVESYAQHRRVLQLVEPYAHWRKIVDKIKDSGGTQTKLIAEFLTHRAATSRVHVGRI